MEALNIGKTSSRAFYQQERDDMPDLEQLRYPVGRFERLTAPLDARRAPRLHRHHRAGAGALPRARRRTFRRASSTRRTVPDGWTIRQVVHHVPDSHMNAYIRMKFAITEDDPGDQGVRRRAVGGAAGGEERARPRCRSRCSSRCIAAGSRSCAALPADRFAQSLRAPGAGPRHARRSDRAVRMALPSPRWSYRARARRLGVNSRGREGGCEGSSAAGAAGGAGR